MRISATVTMTGPIMVRHVTAGNLPYIRIGAAQGEAADCDWSTHTHHGGNPKIIPILSLAKIGYTFLIDTFYWAKDHCHQAISTLQSYTFKV